MGQLFDNVYSKSGALYYSRPTQMLVDYITATGLRAGNALDVGCGDGRNALWLAKRGFNVTAIDNSKEAILKLTRITQTEGLRNRLDVRQESVTHISGLKNKFDLIVASTILCHLDRPIADRLVIDLKQRLATPGHLYLSAFTQEDPSFRDATASASETAPAVINHYPPNGLLVYVADLRLVRYYEGTELDRSHGSPHDHGIARAIACQR